MKRITFKEQLYISAALILMGNLMSFLFKHGILCNVAWVLDGILWMLHPTCPSNQADDKKVIRAVRIAGAIIILIGVMIRFNV